MSQAPVTVTYPLAEVLGQINQKLENLNNKTDNIQKDVYELKIGQTRLEGEVKALSNELKGEIKVLETDIKGVAKRIENQEFINRGVLIAFVVALIGGAAKLFGWVGSP